MSTMRTIPCAPLKTVLKAIGSWLVTTQLCQNAFWRGGTACARVRTRVEAGPGFEVCGLAQLTHGLHERLAQHDLQNRERARGGSMRGYARGRRGEMHQSHAGQGSVIGVTLPTTGQLLWVADRERRNRHPRSRVLIAKFSPGYSVLPWGHDFSHLQVRARVPIAIVGDALCVLRLRHVAATAQKQQRQTMETRRISLSCLDAKAWRNFAWREGLAEIVFALAMASTP